MGKPIVDYQCRFEVGDKQFKLLLDMKRYSILVLLIWGGFVTADIKVRCFDFSSPKAITAPLRDPIPLLPDGKDNTAAGEDAEGVAWGSARGLVNKSISELYEKLLDHYTWKPANKHRLEVLKIVKPGYLEFHELKVNLRPFPLISIDWVEEWGYAVSKGTAKAPEQIVISYQKQEGGTSHIQRLCGSVVLTKKDADNTDVALFQLLKATRQNYEDVTKDQMGTLATLRKPKEPAN